VGRGRRTTAAGGPYRGAGIEVVEAFDRGIHCHGVREADGRVGWKREFSRPRMTRIFTNGERLRHGFMATYSFVPICGIRGSELERDF
jgi:hypothetical protein